MLVVHVHVCVGTHIIMVGGRGTSTVIMDDDMKGIITIMLNNEPVEYKSKRTGRTWARTPRSGMFFATPRVTTENKPADTVRNKKTMQREKSKAKVKKLETAKDKDRSDIFLETKSFLDLCWPTMASQFRQADTKDVGLRDKSKSRRRKALLNVDTSTRFLGEKLVSHFEVQTIADRLSKTGSELIPESGRVQQPSLIHSHAWKGYKKSMCTKSAKDNYRPHTNIETRPSLN